MARNNVLSQNDTLGIAVDLFLTAKKSEGLSPATLAIYTRAVNRFASWLRSQGLSDVTSVTPHIVRKYLVELDSHGFKSSTVHDYTRPVKTMLRFLFQEGVTTVDVFAKVAMPKQDRPVLPAFSTEDVTRLLDACAGSSHPARDRAIVSVLIDTGLRAQELCDLVIGDVDAKTGLIVVRNGKGGKGRSVWLGAAASKALLRYLLSRPKADPGEPLFPSHSSGEHMTTNGLHQTCKRLGKRAGVKNCAPHTFRRSFAIWSLRAGMDIFRLSKLMGHADVDILKQYLALDANDLQAAHNEHGALDSILKSGRGGKR